MPRASNLTVWESVETLEVFVHNTVHRQFLDRRAAWFEVPGQMHFVMWWVLAGHRPSLDEDLAKLGPLRTGGPSEQAFDWAWVKQSGGVV